MNENRIGILVNNIGSPRFATPDSVGDYLNEFLMDKNIIGAPWLVRSILVKGLIVPRRKFASAEKYQSIWEKNPKFPEMSSSPLIQITESFCRGLQETLGSRYIVKAGYRYGEPSIESALADFKEQGLQEIFFLPMYPQWAQATTGSAVEKLQLELAKVFSSKKILIQSMKNKVSKDPQNHQLTEENSDQIQVHILDSYYGDKEYLKILGDQLKATKEAIPAAHVLFSYHGLPVSQVKKIEGCYQTPNCCQLPGACEKQCYKAQCLKTSELIAEIAGLSETSYSSSFQSRLGPTRWIEPATLDVVSDLAKKGVKQILVQTPSFAVDCLETLEEIAVELRHEFISKGGESLILIPSMNDDFRGIHWIAKKIKEN